MTARQTLATYKTNLQALLARQVSEIESLLELDDSNKRYYLKKLAMWGEQGSGPNDTGSSVSSPSQEMEGGLKSARNGAAWPAIVYWFVVLCVVCWWLVVGQR